MTSLSDPMKKAPAGLLAGRRLTPVNTLEEPEMSAAPTVAAERAAHDALTGLRNALAQKLHINLSLTDVEGAAGALDRLTNTIHISPGVTDEQFLAVLADGVRALMPEPEPAVRPVLTLVRGDR